MNAYELADWIESSAYGDYTSAKDAANMLRQQADRIAELEKDLHMIERHYDQLNTQTKPLSDADIQQISHRYHYTYNPDYVGFARAIEEKHGIK